VKVHSFLKLLVTVGIGAVLGFLAVALALCTEGLKSWKNAIARGIIHDGAPHGILRAAIFHGGYSTTLILIGSCLVSINVSCRSDLGSLSRQFRVSLCMTRDLFLSLGRHAVMPA